MCVPGACAHLCVCVWCCCWDSIRSRDLGLNHTLAYFLTLYYILGVSLGLWSTFTDPFLYFIPYIRLETNVKGLNELSGKNWEQHLPHRRILSNTASSTPHCASNKGLSYPAFALICGPSPWEEITSFLAVSASHMVHIPNYSALVCEIVPLLWW